MQNLYSFLSDLSFIQIRRNMARQILSLLRVLRVSMRDSTDKSLVRLRCIVPFRPLYMHKLTLFAS